MKTVTIGPYPYVTPLVIIVLLGGLFWIVLLKKFKADHPGAIAVAALTLPPLVFYIGYLGAVFTMFSLPPTHLGPPIVDGCTNAYIALGVWYLSCRIAWAGGRPLVRMIAATQMTAICLLAFLEAASIHPKEPVISKGGYRDSGLVTGSAPGARTRNSVSHRR